MSATPSSLIIPVQKNRLYADVQEFTSVKPARNHRNLDSLNYVAQLIAHEFTQLDCSVEWQRYYCSGMEVFGLNSIRNPLITKFKI